MSPSAFRRAGHRAIDAVADYLDGVHNRPVNPHWSRQEVFDSLRDSLSDHGIGIEAAVEELSGQLFDQSIAMSHPLYLGLVNSSPLPAAILGDLFVSSIDNNNGATHQGPMLAAAEREVLRAVCKMLGYDGDGLILPGGSYVNLHALQLARTARIPEWDAQGPQALQRLPRVYVSASAHFSVHRAAMALGLGQRALAEIPVDGRGAMQIEALRSTIENDLLEDCRPLAIVATAGTTGTGAIDDLVQVQEVSGHYGTWMHVDACYGGAAALLPDGESMLNGLSGADSVAIDLHKWFFMPLTAGVVLTRHPQVALQAFDVQASYIPDDGYVEAYRRGLPTSRRGTGLAVWLALRAMGWDTIRDAVRRNVELTRVLEAGLRDQGFRVLPEGRLSIACARWEPPGLNAAELDRVQIDLAAAIRGEGTAWLATTRHQDIDWLRFNMVNLHTRRQDVDRLLTRLEKLRHTASDGVGAG